MTYLQVYEAFFAFCLLLAPIGAWVVLRELVAILRGDGT